MHKFSVCGVECHSQTPWLSAGNVLRAAYANGALENEPRDPYKMEPRERTYILGCSKTGDTYNWNAPVNLNLYGGARKFFVNGVGPTTAT